MAKKSACNAGDPNSIPGWGTAPGEGDGNPLQYSCLENSMDRGTWWPTVHGVAKSQKKSLTLLLSSLAVLCWVAQSCPTLCDEAPLSTGILQARIQEWVASPSSKGFFQPRDLAWVLHIAGGFFTIWANREEKDYNHQLSPAGDILMVKSIGWNLSAEIKSWPCCLLALAPWVIDLTCLCFTIIICIIGIWG